MKFFSLLSLIALGSVNCFLNLRIAQKQLSRHYVSNMKMLSIQDTELLLLDRLQQKLLESKSSIESGQGGIDHIFDSLKALGSSSFGNDIFDSIKSISLDNIDLLSLFTEILSNPLTPPLFLIINFILVLIGVGQDDSKIKVDSYSVQKADMFYGSRPLYIFRRLARLANITSAFNIKLLIDWKTGNLEKNSKERAKEALNLSTQLGPTFIKLGQALSIRTDLIPEAYALELRKLQDAVPPFNNDEAKDILRESLGVSNLNEVFKTISSDAIASASIGQVYKGQLLDGKEVAIKIQRPNILSDIALDLYILRLLSPLQVRISNAVNKIKTTPEDIQLALDLVDEWGRGFIQEVDYRLEATNTQNFIEAMERRGLVSVTAPAVVENLSSSRVIVTEWIDGTRLDKANTPDVPRLCSVAINAYLTMLLDTGVLHCDPHLGNLLRTKDGKLCILVTIILSLIMFNINYYYISIGLGYDSIRTK